MMYLEIRYIQNIFPIKSLFIYMQLYRYSPINTVEELLEAWKHIHIECHKFCMNSFGRHLDNSGNLGIFCHYEYEYDRLVEIRKTLTEPSDNPNQKYFKLHEPIVFQATDTSPETAYTHLYIRKPDPYRHHVGDLDFYLPPVEYTTLKREFQEWNPLEWARIFPRTDLDMIELYNPDSDVLAYVSTSMMTERVRIKQS